jgi:hypothetical protein
MVVAGRWLLIALVPVACAEGSTDVPVEGGADVTRVHDGGKSLSDGGNGRDGNARFDASDGSSGVDARRALDAALRDGAGLADSSTEDRHVAGDGAADSGTAVGHLQYQCPVQLSESCVDGSACESTCLGQFQGSPTCTWYSMNAVANPTACMAVSDLATVFTCPVEMSTGCSAATVCESTCVGQVQPRATCTVSGTGGVMTDVSCTTALGGGSRPIYECPVVPSSGCSDTSECQSGCVGQISSLATCTYYGPSAVPATADCTLLGNQTF